MAVLVIASVLLLVAAAEPLALTDGERARLERGEVLVTSSPAADKLGTVATARAVIDAPPDKVWPLVWDCSRFVRTMPSIAKSELVEHKDNTTLCHVVADLPFPFSDLTSLSRAVLEVVPGVCWRRTWKMVEGDYTVNQGSFTLVPWGQGKTLATYQIDARPKVPLPDWMLAKIQTDRLPEMMVRIRSHATVR
ncbi:MAG: SRPBCC family protein [Deltaproteobacteria bacterium]|nr:SRPBCC family protein [Deltaproteobacteria bacterium]